MRIIGYDRFKPGAALAAITPFVPLTTHAAIPRPDPSGWPVAFLDI